MTLPAYPAGPPHRPVPSPMRNVVAGILIAVGGSLLLVGIMIGLSASPDGRSLLPEARVSVDEARAITTAPAVLAFADVTMVVEAEASDGDVFIGTAHPIDADDYMTAMPSLTIEALDSGGVHTGQVVPGERSHRGPVGLDMWRQSVHGPGTQSLALALDGAPVQLVIMPLSDSGTVTLRFGFEGQSMLPLAVGLGIVGVLMGVGGALLWRRRPPTAPLYASGQPQPQGWQAQVWQPQHGQSLPPTQGHGRPPQQGRLPQAPPGWPPQGQPPPVPPGWPPQGQGPQQPHRPTPRTAWRAALAVTCLVPLIAGCTVVPPAGTPWETDTLTMPAMADVAAVKAMVEATEARADKAWAESFKTHKVTPLAQVSTGPRLNEDRFAVAWDKATNKVSARAGNSSVLNAYLPAFSRYPMFLMADVTQKPTNTDQQARFLQVWVRSHADQPWKLYSRSWVLKALPEPPDSDLSTPSAEQARSAVEAANEIGKAMAGDDSSVTLPESLAHIRAETLKTSATVDKTSMSARPYAPFTAKDSAGEGLHMVATHRGTLAVASYVLTTKLYPEPGKTLRWRSPRDKVFGADLRPSLSFDLSLAALYLVDPEGKATIIGWLTDDTMGG